jgi:hypothetical protein
LEFATFRIRYSVFSIRYSLQKARDESGGMVMRTFGAVYAVCLMLPADACRADPPPGLRRSDVVFMYDDPKMIAPYGCTVLGWAGSADAKHVEAAHRQGVRLLCSSVGFLTELSGVIDFTPDFLDAACRSFAGQSFVVPWLWDHKHKGQPAYWWCTNSPTYRKYLESRIEKMMQAPLDGLHIDDYRGTSGAVTWLSACFCRYCMDGFRKYLAERVPKEKLVALEIGDLAAFDYRQFLLDRGVKPAEYNRKRSGLPLAAEFLDFQVKANDAYVTAYRKRAEQLRGKPLALCVNSGITDPHGLVIAPQVTLFCCEVGHQAASRKVPLHPIYAYKLADGVDRPVASTAGGWDWAYVKEHNCAGLVRAWIALSYAFGHHFMAPHYQWRYTQEKGTHWYRGPTQEYAWLYQFVRKNARLFDDYRAVAPVAVVYDNAARRKGMGNIEPICAALAERNVPFRVVIAGDDWLPQRLDAEQLLHALAVIVPADFAKSPMDRAQKKLIDNVKAAGRLVTWPDDKALAALVPPLVTVEGAKEIMAVPRTSARDSADPEVVHLLNRRYDGQKDAVLAAENFTLRLRRELFRGRKFTKAVLHAPQSRSVSLRIATAGEIATIRIPGLELWGIVELSE